MMLRMAVPKRKSRDIICRFGVRPFPTFMFLKKDLQDPLPSIDLETVYNNVDTFKPNHPKCDPEHQRCLLAQRPSDGPLSVPEPLPKNEI